MWLVRAIVRPPDYDGLRDAAAAATIAAGDPHTREAIRAGVDMALCVLTRRTELGHPETTPLGYAVKIGGTELAVTCEVRRRLR